MVVGDALIASRTGVVSPVRDEPPEFANKRLSARCLGRCSEGDLLGVVDDPLGYDDFKEPRH